MSSEPDVGVSQRSAVIRTWAIRLVIAVLVFEVVYVIGANAFLRSGMLFDLINKKPEKMNITWDSAVTYLPGFASVENFELRSQTKKDQIYVKVAEADARISLYKLIFKTIHIRGADARNADFRYRERLDRPPKPGMEDEPRKEAKDVEYWPEIPGFSNPPDPKPEDLYPMKKKKRPWTIKITGAEVEGPIKVALNGVRIEGEGFAGGGVTVKPRESITIHRGRLGLAPTTVTSGPDVVTRDFAINADIEISSFPAKGAKIPDVMGGISGELSMAGQVGDQVAVRQVITPGISTYGAGIIAVNLNLKNGIVRKGSEYSLESDAFEVRVMGLDAKGSATVKGSTEKQSGEHVTTAHIDLGDFQFIDPEDGSVDVSGTGLELDAVWNGLSIAGRVPAKHVALEIPTAQIHDIGAFDAIIPEQAALRLDSGTGEVAAKLEVNDRIGTGTVDVLADDIVMRSKDARFNGDLEVHANLAGGDLETRRFDLSGTTIRLDDIVDETESKKKQKKDEPWYGEVELQQGEVIIGKPLEADGTVNIRMYDTRPIIATLKQLGAGPKWLSMAPNIKNVDGALDLSIGKGHFSFQDLTMTGDGFEALGWMNSQNRKADGRLYVKFKAVAAGVSIDQGKAKIHLSKPRKWFDEQPTGP
jgi:hypothetical protein